MAKGPGRKNHPTPKRRGIHRDPHHRSREGRQAGVVDTRGKAPTDKEAIEEALMVHDENPWKDDEEYDDGDS